MSQIYRITLDVTVTDRSALLAAASQAALRNGFRDASEWEDYRDRDRAHDEPPEAVSLRELAGAPVGTELVAVECVPLPADGETDAARVARARRTGDWRGVSEEEFLAAYVLEYDAGPVHEALLAALRGTTGDGRLRRVRLTEHALAVVATLDDGREVTVQATQAIDAQQVGESHTAAAERLLAGEVLRLCEPEAVR